MKRKEFYKYPKRVCYSLHECAVCGKAIYGGEEYYDGGYNRRCHVGCAPTQQGNSADISDRGGIK